jgi:hypothetical protein
VAGGGWRAVACGQSVWEPRPSGLRREAHQGAMVRTCGARGGRARVCWGACGLVCIIVHGGPHGRRISSGGRVSGAGGWGGGHIGRRAPAPRAAAAGAHSRGGGAGRAAAS